MGIHLTPHGESPGWSIRGSAPITATGAMGLCPRGTASVTEQLSGHLGTSGNYPTRGKLELSPLSCCHVVSRVEQWREETLGCQQRKRG